MTVANPHSRFSVWQLARLAHPAHTRHWCVHRLRYLLRGCLYRRPLARVWSVFSDPLLRALPAHEPSLLDKVTRPYLHAQASAWQRACLMTDHYTFLSQHVPALIAPLYLQDGIEVGHYPVADENGDQFRILLRYEPRFRREGELALSIVDAHNRRWYTCGFSIVHQDGQPALVIGVMQGPAGKIGSDAARDGIRLLTKMGYGMRPRDLLLELVLQLAAVWSIPRVLAVTSHSHVFRSRYYRRRKQGCVKIDYDALWQEWPSEPYNDEFTRLLPPEHKALEEVPSKKRAMYRHRFTWLEQLSSTMQANLSPDRG